MTITITDCYEILHFLKDNKVDHLEPINNTEYTEPINNQKTVFPTITDEFYGMDTLEAYINLNGNTINPTDVTVSFSPLTDGSIITKTYTAETTTITENMVLKFNIDNNMNMTDTSRVLTGTESIIIDFGKTVNNLIIKRIQTKTTDYNITLSSLKKSYEDGYSYVIDKLKYYDVYEESLDTTFRRFIYMASAAFAWLEQWEYEAKPMKSDNIESNNYADRLLSRVDTAIEDYLISKGIDTTINYIDDIEFFQNSDLDWGVN